MNTKIFSLLTAAMLATSAAAHAGPSVDVEINGSNVNVEVYVNQGDRNQHSPGGQGYGYPQLISCYLPWAPVEFVTFTLDFRPAAYTPCYADMPVLTPWGWEWRRFNGHTI